MIYLPDFRHLVQMKYRTRDNIKLVINTNTSYVAKLYFILSEYTWRFKMIIEKVVLSIIYIYNLIHISTFVDDLVTSIPDIILESIYGQNIWFWLNRRKIFANELNILARLLNYSIQDKELFIVSTRQLFFCYIYRQCYWWWNKPVSYTL